ncbi:serine/threonine-protein phosphatase 2A regulatory subunit B'' subunit beta-like isoform X1 [Haliotis asinina]|uniref:serine/threonine-protein phosphatase 2A regulatory subunit B'' subunit beta-like isoform X1 n=1 Tax=Haliotis asinina TaxID=109174 RepID=UPI0035318860
MQKKYACVKYVHSRVTVYYTSKIELKWRRSLHSCAVCDVAQLKKLGLPCGAIHYGICTAVALPFPLNLVNCKKPTGTPAKKPIQRVQPKVISQPAVSNAKEDSLQSILRDEHPPEKDKEPNSRPVIVPHSTEDKENKPKRRDLPTPRTSVHSSANIPKFYFPMGRPPKIDNTDSVLQKVAQEFSNLEGGKAYKQQMGLIAKACGVPFYWKCPLFRGSGGDKQGYITYQMFASMWKKLMESYHDEASRFVKLLAKPNCNYIDDEDLVPLVQDVVESHPGLSFLQEAPEFHSRYINTVIARMFFSINRLWTGRLTVQEIRQSSLLRTLALLEDEEDINQITDFFSYEHFYVIYCKFWELDKDHDLFIDRGDLARHNDHALSSRVIDRIFSGAVTRGENFKVGRMSYPEFVWFLIAEEDKRHPTSVEYWFRCMDLDGDGIISMYEMEYFYEEQMQKMEAIGIEKLPFEDCLCQMLDLVRPKHKEQITLSDLKSCKMTNIFFDTFFNLDKFLEHEQRDPFANVRDPETDGPEPSDWEKYAAEEYEILVAEEGANEQEEIHYEDDFEPDDDDSLGEEIIRLADVPQRKSSPVVRQNPADDIYDFSTKNLGY